jgi:hypothetical protein
MANTTVNVDIQVQSKTLGQLEDQLTEINDELRQVEVGSQAFKDLTKEAQALTREVEKVNEEITGFTFDEKIRAADGGVKLFSGTLSGLVGTLGVLGVESEAFGEFEKKAASAIAVGVGFKDISEGIQQLGPALSKGGTAFLKFAKTTRGALIATGVGAFVVAITAVAMNWDKVTAAVTKFGQAVPFVGKAIEGIKNAFNTLFEAAKPILRFLGILPTEAEEAQMAINKQTEATVKDLERQLSIAQAQGKSAKELFDLKKQIIEQELLLLQDKEDAEQEYFDKTTELLTLEAAERKRLHDERLAQAEEQRLKDEEIIAARQVQTVNAIESKTLETKITGDLLKAQTTNEIVATEEDLKLAELKKQSRFQMLDVIQQTTDQESAIGRAAFIARQALLLQELAMEAKAKLTEIAMTATKGGLDVSAGFAKTLAKGFPLNVPLLIAYGIQAAAIIKSIRDATKKAKSAVPKGGGSINIPQPASTVASASPSSIQQGLSLENSLSQLQAPQFQNLQPTVRAYVLSGDVTTAQEADAKLSNRRTLAD